MAPKSPSKAVKLTTDPSPLPLPSLLKLLTSPTSSASSARPHLTAHQAMLLLAKLVPAGYTSHAKLRTLTQVDLVRIGVEDEESRKGMMSFLGKRESAKGKGKAKAVETAAKKEEEGEFSAGVKRKRPGRESDLDKPLPSREVNRAAVDEDFDFEEITYEEALLKKTVITNRAPVMTAWSFVVSERLGFKRQEALSIAHVFTDLNAASKGVSLGILPEGSQYTQVGSSQPFVDILGRKVPVLSTQNGEWRAISKGLVAEPEKAYSYMRRGFQQQLGAVIGSMRLLADSFDPEELNKKGYALYLDFRPEVEGWGKKGELTMLSILGLRRFLTHPDPLPGLDGNTDDGGALKKEEDGGGFVRTEEGGEVKIEDGKVENGDEGSPRKRVKTEGGGEEDVKPVLPKPPAAKDELDEFDEFDDGIDYSLVPLDL